MALINKILTREDITNGVLDAVMPHFEEAFPADERRSRDDLTFTDADGPRRIRGIESLIREPNLENSQVSLVCRFQVPDAKYDISINPDETFRAGMLAYSFPATNFAFIEYLFVPINHRNKGDGIRIVKHTLDNILRPAGVTRVFGEVEREVDFSSPDQRKKVETRLKLYEKLGGFPLFADYTQPAYGPEQNPVSLHPVLVNLDGKSGISAGEFITFIAAFYQDVYGLTNGHQYIRHLRDSIRGHDIIDQREVRYAKTVVKPMMISKS